MPRGGPQTEGDLRARASRMEPLADLAILRGYPRRAGALRKLVHFLSPPGQKRGVFVAHGLYPPEEFERVRQAFANRVADDDEVPARLSTAREELVGDRRRDSGWVGEVAALRAPGRQPALRLESSLCGGPRSEIGPRSLTG